MFVCLNLLTVIVAVPLYTETTIWVKLEAEVVYNANNHAEVFDRI